MPVITIDLAVLDSKEKKSQLVEALTLAASGVTLIPKEKFIVIVNELDRDNIGVGGRLLSDIVK